MTSMSSSDSVRRDNTTRPRIRHTPMWTSENATPDHGRALTRSASPGVHMGYWRPSAWTSPGRPGSLGASLPSGFAPDPMRVGYALTVRLVRASNDTPKIDVEHSRHIEVRRNGCTTTLPDSRVIMRVLPAGASEIARRSQPRCAQASRQPFPTLMCETKGTRNE
jgi:hypothetical protein